MLHTTHDIGIQAVARPSVSNVDISYVVRCDVRSDTANRAETTPHFLCGMRYASAKNRGRDVFRSRINRGE
jgi:hypothetical protein